LAAILSADAVGYSRLMADDEEATIQTLRSYRRLIQMLVEEHRGRVVDTPGDNVMAEFPTALAAVTAAAEIQRVLAARNAGLAEPRRMQFRIGIHMGDIASEGGRVYGDGVNVAARLEGLAEPGGISVSGTVHEQVSRKLEFGFADMGAQRIKNMPDTVRVFQVRLEAARGTTSNRRLSTRWVAFVAAGLVTVAVGVGVWWFALPLAPTADPEAASMESLSVPGFDGRPAIAVLPFDNLSGDPEQEYFADGIAEDLLTRLAAWRSFPVIARNSSFVYKGRAVDVKQISRELGARYVVEGSVRRAGSQVRITAQLIDASTGHHVWAERYDRELSDVFSLQDEITEAIVAAINPALLDVEIERVLRKPPADLAAWELALRARSLVITFSREDNDEARALCQRALELDPRLAQSYAALASTHYNDVWFQWTEDAQRSIADGLRAAQRAVELDAGDPRGHVAVGLGNMFTGATDQVLAAMERALELDPSSTIALSFWGGHAAVSGRGDEGIAAIERAIRLSPRDPQMWLHWDNMTYAQFAAGHYERTIEAARQVMRVRTDYVYPYIMLAASAAQLGRDADARAAIERAIELQPDLSIEFVQSVFASMSDGYRSRLAHGLRLAGVPES
jgi:adenylate cyclase